MNSIISLVVRSLYSLVVVFFFVFTVQPAVAAGKYDEVIQDISGYITRDGWWSNELPDMKSLPANDKTLRDKILAIKDADGNNIAHRVLGGYRNTGEILQVFRVVGIEAFRERNAVGLKSFEENPRGLESIFQSDATLVAGQASLLTTLQNSLKPFIPSAVQREMAGYLASRQTLDQLRREESALEWGATTDPHETKRADLSIRIRDLNDNLERVTGSLASLIVCLDAGAVPPLRLEQIDVYNFYYQLSQTEAGRKLLKSYRTAEGKTLYNYFSEKEGQSVETEGLLSRLIIPFILDGQVPTPDKVDIKKLSWRLTGCFQSGPTDLRLKSFFEQYKNRQGQNLAFLAAAAGDVRFLQEEMQSKGVDVMAMLQVKDIHGNDGISQITNAYEYDVVDPRLRELIEAKEQENFRLQEEAQRKAEDDFNAMPLNDGLLSAAISIFGINNPQHFADIILRSVLYKGSSPLRDSFLQQNPTDFSGQAQANQLWKSFFTTYDELGRQERERYCHYDGVFVCDESMISPPVRVLNVFQRFGQYGISPAVVETIHALQSNVLATGGTFGMNFNRTANEHEARIMIEQLTNFGISIFEPEYTSFKGPIDEFMENKTDSDLSEISKFIRARDSGFDEELVDIDDASERIFSNIVSPFVYEIADEIAGRFFSIPSLGLSPEQKFKLEEHQTNCAVIALHYICEKIYHEDYIFSAMDEILANRRMEHKNSRQRYKEVMQMAGYDLEWMRTPLSSSRNSRSNSVSGDDLGEG